MLALIMAGGAGSRLNLGEKPLVLVNDRPMIGYVIAAFAGAGCRVLVATSQNTPMTRNWCRAQGIDSFTAGGNGYVRDMEEAVKAAGEEGPLFVSVSDIPCIDATVIRAVREAYERSGKDACSTWVPSSLVQSLQGGASCTEMIDGINAIPAGLNILTGSKIAEEQDELRLVLAEPRLAINVNTREDLESAETYLKNPSKQR